MICPILLQKSRMFFLFAVLLLVFFLFVLLASAEDAMFRANPEHTGVYNDGGIVKNNKLWTFSPGSSYDDSSVVVADGVVFLASDNKNLYAMDAVTGQGKWHFTYGVNSDSSPAVVNGIIYVGSDDNYLYSINALTGSWNWRFITGDDIHSSPMEANGVVYG
jgi:outer membrane protein assembly factor BamB